MEDKSVVIDGVEYVPASTVPEPVATVQKEAFFSFLKSPQFWMIGVASVASVLVRDDFQSLPWNMIVGQILTLWGGGASTFGLVNKVSKNVAQK